MLMRILRWITLVWGLAFCLPWEHFALGDEQASPFQQALAEDDEGADELQPSGYDGNANGGGNGVVPADYGVNGGSPYSAYPNQPAYYYQPDGNYAPEVPSTMMPWPMESPFSADFNQTRQDGGLWMNESNNRGRQWYGGLNLLYLWYRTPGQSRIGFANDSQAQGPQTISRLTKNTDPEEATEIPDDDFDAFIDSSITVDRGQAIRDWGTFPYRASLSTLGVSPYIGFNNPDESGFEMSGFIAGAKGDTSAFGDQSAPAIIERINLDYTQASPLVFDGLFKAGYTQQGWGGQADWYTTPVLGRGTNKLRASYGVRYLGIHELGQIDGADSSGQNLYMQSSVYSHLVGPQAGLRWDLGGKKFKVVTYGKVAALVNMNQMDLDVVNYGGVTQNLRVTDTHISPLLDAGIMAEMPLFGYVPGLNKVPVLRDANFRFGWSYFAAFLVSRPYNLIGYTAPAPRIEYHPKVWDLRGFTFGMEWKF